MLTDRVYELFKEQKKSAMKVGSRYVFFNKWGNKINTNVFSKYIWKDLFQKPDLNWIRYRVCYKTRHTFISMALRAGENPLFVSEYVGHSDPSILFKYYAKYMPSNDGSKFDRFTRDLHGNENLDNAAV